MHMPIKPSSRQLILYFAIQRPRRLNPKRPRLFVKTLNQLHSRLLSFYFFFLPFVAGCSHWSALSCEGKNPCDRRLYLRLAERDCQSAIVTCRLSESSKRAWWLSKRWRERSAGRPIVCEHKKGKRRMNSLLDAGSLTTKLEDILRTYYDEDEDEWRLAKKTNDVSAWRKPSEEFNGFLYKVEGVVKEAPNRIVDYIRPGPYRLDWDTLMTSMDIVHQFDQGCCVMKYTTAGQLWNIISPREFVDFSYTTQYYDGLLSCGISIEFGEAQPGFVRGFNHPCGWFCVPLKDNPEHSLLTGFIQTELRGMLPQSAVDTAMASSLVNFYTDLRKALKV
ncbi:stAR-related lipid transfer protein 4 isoform X2 [Latimeria chalumnae]|uniref:stAR-related lipid transfer protein 4 isoform X2 n=1 Tax=Latimeria chalumnae TaxID=7897 RepID=UPI00313AE2B4